jgi:hypothetical protein
MRGSVFGAGIERKAGPTIAKKVSENHNRNMKNDYWQ